MRHTELMDRLKRLENESLFIEAFLLRSVYVESVISTLSMAYRSHQQGFDGYTKKVRDAVNNDPEFKKEFKEFEDDYLNEKIKDVLKTGLIDESQYRTLHRWKNEYRKEVFHHFTKYFMAAGALEKICREGYDLIKTISESPWFKKMEDALVKTEEQFPWNSSPLT